MTLNRHLMTCCLCLLVGAEKQRADGIFIPSALCYWGKVRRQFRAFRTTFNYLDSLLLACFRSFSNGNLYDKYAIIRAMNAGNKENNDQIIVRTELVTEAGSIIWLLFASVIMQAPARLRNKAISEPEIAPPNFCAMVPEEKIRPVEEDPFFSVA